MSDSERKVDGTISGQVMVEGGAFSKWKPMHCVLSTSGALLFFKTEEDFNKGKEEKERIDLTNCVVSAVEYKKQPHVVSILLENGAQHHIVLESAEAQQEWIIALQNGAVYSKLVGAEQSGAEFLSPPLLAAYMHKHDGTNWVRHYFVLTRNFLYLFRNSQDTIPVAGIALIDFTVANINAEELSVLRSGGVTRHGDKVDVSHSFRFRCHDSELLIAPPDQESHVSWTRALADPSSVRNPLSRTLGAAASSEQPRRSMGGGMLGPRVMLPMGHTPTSAPKLGIPEAEKDDDPEIIHAVHVPKDQRVASRTYVDYSLKLGMQDSRITMPDGSPGIQQVMTVGAKSGHANWNTFRQESEIHDLHKKLFDAFFNLRFPPLPPEEKAENQEGSEARGLSHHKSWATLQDAVATGSFGDGDARSRGLSRTKTSIGMAGVVDAAIAHMQKGGEDEAQEKSSDYVLDYWRCYFRELVSHPFVASSSSMLAFLELNQVNRIVSTGDFDFVRSFAFSPEELGTIAADGRSVLHFAVLSGVAEIVHWLMDRGRSVRVGVDHQDRAGNTALHLAASKGYHEVASSLLQNGINASIVNRDEAMAIHCACEGKSLIIGKVLADAAPETINQPDANGQTPMHVAAAHDAESLLLEFLGHDEADPSIRDSSDRTPLHLCAMHALPRSAKRIVERGVDQNIADDEGKTALHYACANEDSAEIASMLISLPNTDLTLPDHSYMTPLHHCASSGLVSLCGLLATRDTSVLKTTDAQGRTPLHLVIVRGNVELTDLFLKLGADPNATDMKGNFSLMLAVTDGGEASQALIETLGRYKVNADVRDPDGHMPLTRAALLGYDQTITTLVEIGADLEAEMDGTGNTALHVAAQSGRAGVCNALVAAGADTGSTNAKGETPLHNAIRSGKVAVAKTLVEIGADLDAKDHEGKRCRDLAPPALLPKLRDAADSYVSTIGGVEAVTERRKKLARERQKKRAARSVRFKETPKGPPKDGGAGIVALSSLPEPAHVPEEAELPADADPILESLFQQLLTPDTKTLEFFTRFLKVEDTERQGGGIERLNLLVAAHEIMRTDGNVEKTSAAVRLHVGSGSEQFVPLTQSVYASLVSMGTDKERIIEAFVAVYNHLECYLRNHALPLFLQAPAYGDTYTHLLEVEEKEAAKAVKKEWLRLCQDVGTVVYAQTNDEPSLIPIDVGDVVLVLDNQQEWWFGVNQKGAEGYFPPAHIAIENDVDKVQQLLLDAGFIDEEEAAPPTPSSVSDADDLLAELDSIPQDSESVRRSEAEKWRAKFEAEEKARKLAHQTDEDIRLQREEEKKKEEEERKAEADRKRRAEMERRRAIEEERRMKDEAERKRLLALRQRQEEDARLRKEEVDKRRREEGEKKAEADRKRRAEMERRRAIEEERRKKEEADMKHMMDIRQKQEEDEKRRHPPQKSLPAPTTSPVPPPFSPERARTTSFAERFKVQPPPKPVVTPPSTTLPFPARPTGRPPSMTVGAPPPKPRGPPPVATTSVPIRSTTLAAPPKPKNPPPVSVTSPPPAPSKPPPRTFSFSRKHEDKPEASPPIKPTQPASPPIKANPAAGGPVDELANALQRRRLSMRHAPVDFELPAAQTSPDSTVNNCSHAGCDCEDFQPHPFKKKQCRNCFHEH